MGTTVSTIADLNAAISAADALAAPGTFTITLGANIALGGTVLDALDLAPDVTLDLVGNGHTLDGGGSERGLFVYAGAVSVESLAINDMLAAGGDGSGGGAGLGGGLFVGANVTGDAGQVTLTDVSFAGDAAKGGAGVGGGYGGGGGLDSNGGGGFGTGWPGVHGSAGSYTTGGAGGAGGGAGGIARWAPNGPPGFTDGYSQVGWGSGGFGGYGGGGGGGWPAGAGGFGGGGGGASDGAGGEGGFGGGGGNGLSNEWGRGAGGFGGGEGGATFGGGGLAAGGDIFVQQGATLSIAGTSSLGAGTLMAGAGANPGQAFADGIYLQGSSTLTFAPTGTETVSGVIGDDTGSAAAAQYGGAGNYTEGTGNIVVTGSGTLKFTGVNSYTGGATIEGGATLDLAANGAGGSGAIVFSGPGTLQIAGADLIASHGIATFANTIDSFGLDDTIDLPSIGTDTAAAAVAFGNTLAVVVNGATTDLPLGGPLPTGARPVVQSDGAGGSAVSLLYSIFTIDTVGQLNAAIAAANALATPRPLTFELGGNIDLDGTALEALNLPAGMTLDIAGNGFTLDGGGMAHGLAVTAGAVTVQDLAIDNMLATGTGGGAAGLGGGLFIGSGVTSDPGRVALYDVSFADDAAAGAAGGAGDGGAGDGGAGDGGGGFGQGGGIGGAGGFGGGDGGATVGGGGLAAGADIFVQSGASLTIAGRSDIAAGALMPGAGANPGQAFADGIYLQGDNTLTFRLSGIETISGAIGDDRGSAAAAGYGGAADYAEGSVGVVVAGFGTLVMQAANTYSGGTTVDAGATLEIAAGASAGSGAIVLADPTSSVIFDVASAAELTAALAAVKTVQGDGTATIALGGAALTAGGPAENAALDIAANGQSVIRSLTFYVTTAAELNQAILTADLEPAPADVAIVLGADISLAGTTMDAIDLARGVSLHVEGNGYRLDGGGRQHGFFVYAGRVALENLGIDNMLAAGGDGVSGGGGGAGLGGGLFVGAAVAGDPGAVDLTNVLFSGDAARGGDSFSGTGGTGGGPSGGWLDGRVQIAGYSAGGAGIFTLGAGGFGGGDDGGGAGFGGGGRTGRTSPATGGFGGGQGGADGTGGGGFAAGGDIFVQQGASITIAGTSGIGAGTLTPGGGASEGNAFGDGIYLQGDNTLTFAPLGTETVSGVIGDDQGSAAAAGYRGVSGYAEGKVGLLQSGIGTLRLATANTFSGGITLDSGAVELAARGAAGTGAITFGGAATLVIDQAALNGAGTLFNLPTILDPFAAGDAIDLPGLAYTAGASATPDPSVPGQLDVASGGTTVDLAFTGTDLTHLYAAADGTGGTEIVPCFAAGTCIATARGPVAVEHLRPGDRVWLADGAQAAVVWLGHRNVSVARHPRPWDVNPVRVQAGAFGPGRPVADVYLSPDHAVFIDGALIPVRYLLNGRSIAQVERQTISYWHVELERHAVLLAEGLPCESFLDTGNRAAFANGDRTAQMQPDFALRIWQAAACAPLVRGGPALTAARQAVLGHARRLGHRLSDDPKLVVLADHRRLVGQRDGVWWRFRLPADARCIRLTSRSWIPAHTRPDEADARTLGVAIADLWLGGRRVGLEGAAFGAGWHPPEPEWRWTDGDGAIAANGARDLILAVAMTGTYWQDKRPRTARAA